MSEAIKVRLVLDKVFAKGTGKVKTVTIVLFKFGPVLLGSMMMPGRVEDDEMLLREARIGRKIKWVTDDPILRGLIIPNKEQAA